MSTNWLDPRRVFRRGSSRAIRRGPRAAHAHFVNRVNMDAMDTAMTPGASRRSEEAMVSILRHLR